MQVVEFEHDAQKVIVDRVLQGLHVVEAER